MRPIIVPVAAAFTTLAALTACTGVTSGHGRGVSAPSPTPTARPTPTASGSPVAAEQPQICHDRCRTVARADLGSGYTVELAQAPGATPISVLILRAGFDLREATWIEDERPGSLAGSTRPAVNCVFVDGVGMHASQAHGVTFGNWVIDEFDSVNSDTPVILAKDLDHDGWIDVIAEESTERPSYATGPRYWVTVLSDGHKLTGTGCTTPTAHEQPVPTIVLTGDCA